MNILVALVIAAPLMAATIGLLLRSHPVIRETLAGLGLGTAAGSSIALLIGVVQNGTVTVRVGGWHPELGIVLVADLFAALVLPWALTIIFVVELYAIGQRRTAWGSNPELSGPLLAFLTAGLALAFLTGDLFTLFVSFEVILVSSYVLLTHQGRRGQVRAGMTYVVMNLFVSALFLFGLALVYAATGTVNLALLAERIPDLPDAVRLGIGAWFFVVFGTKAAVFPLFSWLPDAYPTAPTSITAVFAGLLTKVGIYALIRFHTVTGMNDLGPLLLAVAAGTMVIGAIGALAQSNVKRILSFHIISQIGYMLMGLGLFSVAGIGGAIFFLLHHMPVKTVLFLVGGLIENEQRSGSLDNSGGLAARTPLVAGLFAIPALSLAGIPPFSGFVAKLAVVSAAVEQASIAVVVAALVAGFLTILSMNKIWIGVFWGDRPDEVKPIPTAMGNRWLMRGSTAIAVAATLFIAALAGSLLDLSERAAVDLMDPAVYIAEVLS